MARTPIEDVEQLAPHSRQSKALGYRTLEQFLGAAHASGADMGRFLQTNINGLLESLPKEAAPLVSAAREYAAGPGDSRWACGWTGFRSRAWRSPPMPCPPRPCHR